MSRKVVKAVSWVVVSNVLSKILSFITMSYLARVLNPTGIGLYSAVMSSSGSVNQICDLGTSVVLQRTGARINEIGNHSAGYRLTLIFLLQVLLNFIISFTIYFYPDLFNKTLLFNVGENATIRAIGIIAMLQILSQVPLTFILGLGEFKVYAIRMMLGNLVILISIIIFLILTGGETQQAIQATIAGWIFNTLYSLFILKRVIDKYDIPLSLRKIRTESESIFKEGFVYYLGNTFSGAVYNIMMLGLFSKFIGLGEYGFVRMASAMVAILGILPAALQPVTISLLAGNYQGGARFRSLQLRFIAIISFIITIGLIFFIDEAIYILFGNEYLQGKPIFIFMIFMNFIILLSSLISNFLVANGQASYIGKVSLLCTALNILFSFLLLPQLGMYGYFISYAIGYGLGFIFVLFREFRFRNYPDFTHLRKFGFFLLIASISIAPILFIENFYWALIYKVAYIFCMFVILVPVAFTNDETAKVLALLKLKPTQWLKRNH